MQDSLHFIQKAHMRILTVIGRSRCQRHVYEGTTPRSQSATAAGAAPIDGQLYTSLDRTYEEPSILITRPSEAANNAQPAVVFDRSGSGAYEEIPRSMFEGEERQMIHEYENAVISRAIR